MNNHRVSNLTTVLVQSITLFIVGFLCMTLPHALKGTYATVLGGQCLPALTQWLITLSGNFAATACILVMISFTHACIGIILIFAPVFSDDATHRILLLTTIGWAASLFWIVLTLAGLTLPFFVMIGRLQTPEEHYAAVVRGRIWMAATIGYALALTATTMLVCRRKRTVGPAGEPYAHP